MRHPNCEHDPSECRIMKSDIAVQSKPGGHWYSQRLGPEVFDGNGNVIPKAEITTVAHLFCTTCGRGWAAAPEVGTDEHVDHLPAVIEGEHPHE